jgi:hypothetical protein
MVTTFMYLKKRLMVYRMLSGIVVEQIAGSGYHI